MAKKIENKLIQAGYMTLSEISEVVGRNCRELSGFFKKEYGIMFREGKESDAFVARGLAEEVIGKIGEYETPNYV